MLHVTCSCADDRDKGPKDSVFRALTDAGIYCWDLLDENMDMLAACTTETIFSDKPRYSQCRENK